MTYRFFTNKTEAEAAAYVERTNGRRSYVLKHSRNRFEVRSWE